MRQGQRMDAHRRRSRSPQRRPRDDDFRRERRDGYQGGYAPMGYDNPNPQMPMPMAYAMARGMPGNPPLGYDTPFPPPFRGQNMWHQSNPYYPMQSGPRYQRHHSPPVHRPQPRIEEEREQRPLTPKQDPKPSDSPPVEKKEAVEEKQATPVEADAVETEVKEQEEGEEEEEEERIPIVKRTRICPALTGKGGSGEEPLTEAAALLLRASASVPDAAFDWDVNELCECRGLG